MTTTTSDATMNWIIRTLNSCAFLDDKHVVNIFTVMYVYVTILKKNYIFK